MSNRETLREKAETRLVELACVIRECQGDSVVESCDICDERRSDVAIISELLAALTEAGTQAGRTPAQEG